MRFYWPARPVMGHHHIYKYGVPWFVPAWACIKYHVGAAFLGGGKGEGCAIYIVEPQQLQHQNVLMSEDASSLLTLHIIFAGLERGDVEEEQQ